MTKTFREIWVDVDLGSDHNIIVATFNHKGTSNMPIINLYHKANWDLTNNNISETMATHQLNHKSSPGDIDQYTNKLTITIENNLTQYVKLISIMPVKIGLPSFIRELVKEKEKLKKKYQRTRNIKSYMINQ